MSVVFPPNRCRVSFDLWIGRAKGRREEEFDKLSGARTRKLVKCGLRERIKSSNSAVLLCPLINDSGGVPGSELPAEGTEHLGLQVEVG